MTTHRFPAFGLLAGIFAALAAGAGVITFQIQRHSGAIKESGLIPLVPRLLNAALSAVRYLGKTLAAADLWQLGGVARGRAP
jgi:hypothetical protein